MSLAPGVRLGAYEVLSLIGAGGMGEVYRARDTRLGRDVAIKVLPDAFTNDSDRLARFKREAQVLASLNHPNIAAIYGLEESPAGNALVLELVEGPTLAERIAHGAIPLDEALPVAKQIAEALEAAHEHGIIHRDLKPANIKLTNGKVKVLDFGLAKTVEASGSRLQASGLSQSPTITSPAMTLGGVILGTAAYMSPEQAKGKAVDRRTDMWAFGCVLYEMLTGNRAFEGDDVSDTLAAILRADPNLTHLPATTPQSIRRLLKRSFEKDRTNRLSDAGDARLEIDDALAPEPHVQAAIDPRSRGSRERIALAVAALAVLGAIGAIAALFLLRNPARAATPVTFQLFTPEGTRFQGGPNFLSLSPDGTRLIFAVADQGANVVLWQRALDALSAQRIPGTEGASHPFWSPDGRFVAFHAGGKLKKIPISGGPAQLICDAPAGFGGTWNSDNVILFSPSRTGPIHRVSANGGTTTPVTSLEGQGDISHSWPHFLPDGRRFLYYARNPQQGGIYLRSLDAENAKLLVLADSNVSYVEPGYLVYTRENVLLAQPFDARAGEITGEPVTLAEEVYRNPTTGRAAFVASSGVLAYLSHFASAASQLVWHDRSGRVIASMGPHDEASLLAPELSPDDSKVAVQRTLQSNTDIFVIDAIRTERLTLDPATDAFPIWSPDGGTIVFDSSRKDRRNLFQKAYPNAGNDELLLDMPEALAANDWSRDGRFILFTAFTAPNDGDIWVLPVAGDRKPYPLVKTAFDERSASFSPDGGWVAYNSAESGRLEVYVRSFQGSVRQRMISTGGGSQPRWNHDGSELYYIAPDAMLMAVPFKIANDVPEPGRPAPLFQTRIVGGGVIVNQRRQYDVSRDGRFLINTGDADGAAAPITVVLNWMDQFIRR